MNRAISRTATLSRALPKLKPYWLKRRFYAQRMLALMHRGRIPSGPFEGMRYVSRWWRRVPNPAALLGTYELELWSVIERVVQSRPGLIVDVGMAEGYYTAGLALRCPESRVVGFESNDTLGPRRLELEALNSLRGRVVHRGTCDPAALDDLLHLRLTTFLLVDVDGGEAALLDPSRIRRLAETEILVEIHDHRVPGTSTTLLNRFGPTHDIEIIPSRRRTAIDLPPHPRWFEGRMLKLADERDLAHQWFWMRPKTPQTST